VCADSFIRLEIPKLQKNPTGKNKKSARGGGIWADSGFA
jgi:hypothetical protein